jgi:hypothetical protein
LFDQTSQLAYRFEPPFAMNMTPAQVLASGTGYRAMCVDSRHYPPSVTLASNSVTNRLPLDGSASLAVVNAGGGGLDGDPLVGRTYLVNKGMNTVSATAGGPNLLQDLNIVGMCAPVALGPTSVALNPLNGRTFVLAEDGVNPACLPGSAGGNHVVSLPPAINPLVLPEVLTDPHGSGISGANGDLALVLAEFGFPAPYGSGCAAASTGTPALLDCNVPPVIGSPGFALEISGAPAAKPVYLLLGFQPLAQTQPSGCSVLVLQALPAFLIGVTNGAGALTVVAPIPLSAPPGARVYLQSAFADSGTAVLSNGLLLNIGP